LFVDRERELEALRERLTREGFELIVVYGRRRVGKTALVLEALRRYAREGYIYYQAVERGNLDYFLRTATRVEPRLRLVARDWEAVLEMLAGRVIVIDEFPYIVEEERSFLSRLQRLVDHVLQRTNTKLVLLSSSISLTRSHALDYGSPLHGRITARLRVQPMDYLSVKGFHPGYSWRELAEVYGFAGGVPLYHLRVGKESFWDWLDRELRRPGTWIVDEADIILRSEFRETRVYRGIIEAVAYGRARRKEIADYLGIDSSRLGPYLERLELAGIIERVWPVTEPPTTKKTRYRVRDLFLAFWHRYILPNRSLIEEGVLGAEDIRPDYDSYMGMVFEAIARQIVARLRSQGRLPVRYNRAGPWWHREWEVDLLLIDDHSREAMLVEVKWSRVTSREQHRILYRLEEAAQRIPAIRGYRKTYGLIAREIEPGGPRELWKLGLDTLGEALGPRSP